MSEYEQITSREAREALEQYLALLPDSILPKVDKYEVGDDGIVIAWYGSTGYHIASTRNGNGINVPKANRWGVEQALQGEALRRIDRAEFARKYGVHLREDDR